MADPKAYAYRALEQIQTFDTKLQAEIEWLRANMLPKLAETKNLLRNSPDPEYRFTWTTREVIIDYYLRFGDRQAVIFNVEKLL